MNLKNSDKQYDYTVLLESEIDTDPIKQFEKWFNESIEKGLKYANAFALATSSKNGLPNARFLLLKGFDKDGFVFYTNSESIKGIELKNNPQAYMVFWWDIVERQVRISGDIYQVSDQDSDDYFKTRPRGSQIGAWASKQSTIIDSRDILESSYKDIEKKYEGLEIPRPPYWIGYRLKPNSIEFWQGRPDRLHDRLRYRLTEDRRWIIERLSP
jgi:pyridoxamine 5'-phosphate oxidase